MSPRVLSTLPAEVLHLILSFLFRERATRSLVKRMLPLLPLNKRLRGFYLAALFRRVKVLVNHNTWEDRFNLVCASHLALATDVELDIDLNLPLSPEDAATLRNLRFATEAAVKLSLRTRKGYGTPQDAVAVAAAILHLRCRSLRARGCGYLPPVPYLTEASIDGFDVAELPATFWAFLQGLTFTRRPLSLSLNALHQATNLTHFTWYTQSDSAGKFDLPKSLRSVRFNTHGWTATEATALHAHLGLLFDMIRPLPRLETLVVDYLEAPTPACAFQLLQCIPSSIERIKLCVGQYVGQHGWRHVVEGSEVDAAVHLVNGLIERLSTWPGLVKLVLQMRIAEPIPPWSARFTSAMADLRRQCGKQGVDLDDSKFYWPRREGGYLQW
jgi:hypothetical protein